MQSQIQPQAGQGHPPAGQWYPQPGQVPLGQPGLPPPTVVIAAPPRQTKVEAYNCDLAVKFGVSQIVIGILLITLNIAAYVVHTSITNVIFYGIMIILAGAFEVTSGKNNTRCWVITTMVFAILAAIFAASAVITPAIAIGLNDETRSGYYWIDDRYQDEPAGYYDARYVINGALVILAVTEFVIAILAAVLTCKGVCCYTRPLGQQQGVIISQPGQYGQPVTGNQVVYPGQQAMAPAPPAYNYQTADYAPPAYQPLSPPVNPAAPPAPEGYPTEESKKNIP